MYCGDETGSFVGDIGSHVARFGYGGEDSPKYVFSSRCVDVEKRHVLSSCYKYPTSSNSFIRTVMQPPTIHSYDQPNIDPITYLSQGECVYDWDAYQIVWETALDRMMVRHPTKHRSYPVSDTVQNQLTTPPTPTTTSLDQPVVHPLLVVSPGNTALTTSTTSTTNNNNNNSATSKSQYRKQIQQMTELCMETFQCPAFFVAPTPMLAAFSMGRSTATVVDLGAGGCRVTPVVDGLLLQQAQRRNGRGGDWLDHILWHASTSSSSIVNNNNNNTNKIIQPRYQLSSAFTTTTNNSNNHNNNYFHRWAMQDLFQELRTSESIWPLTPTLPTTSSPFQSSTESILDQYQLPDGTTLNVTQDMCQIYELLFSNTTPFLDSSLSLSLQVLQQHSTFSNAPLHQLIHESLSAVDDVAIRKELASQIVVVGGMASIPQLASTLSGRLQWPTTFTPKIHCSQQFVEERSSAAWIGGSILTSLGSFQQLWLSQAEYQEYGSTLAIQRFP